MIIRRSGAARTRKRSASGGMYSAAVRQSRAQYLYAVMGAPDTIEGRFELLTLHVILLLETLRGRDDIAQATSQALFDLYVRDLDGALREMGVGDFSVVKRMRALGNAFYGRAAAYRQAFAELPDRDGLTALVRRTILGDEDGANPESLAAYVIRCWSLLEAMPTLSLLDRGPSWPSH